MRMILNAIATVLVLLCMLVPQHGATSNAREDQNAVHPEHDAEIDSLWSKLSQYVPHQAAAAFSKFEDLPESAIELPSWESIVSSANGLLKAADESLNAAAREFNVAGKIDEFRNTLQTIVSASSEIRGRMVELTQKGLTLDQISDELGIVFNDILVYLRRTFPPPDRAPSHEERQKMVTSALDKAEQGLLDFARKHGMSEDGLESLRGSFNQLKPHLEKLVVITGDLTEQHPTLFNILISTPAAMLIPESWILRPLLSMMGFGLYGPVKGSPAAWAQRQFWGAAVGKGSWFAILQRAGMKEFSVRPIMGVVGGAVGAVYGKFFP